VRALEEEFLGLLMLPQAADGPAPEKTETFGVVPVNAETLGDP
jgi:hypothetical protein